MAAITYKLYQKRINNYKKKILHNTSEILLHPKHNNKPKDTITNIANKKLFWGLFSYLYLCFVSYEVKLLAYYLAVAHV